MNQENLSKLHSVNPNTNISIIQFQRVYGLSENCTWDIDKSSR